uniref:Poly [ADP-ribose] polymerase n=1 Tax=Arcella intermedia TaxID=1963864 RepID=A0A6B2KXW8_9EUKA
MSSVDKKTIRDIIQGDYKEPISFGKTSMLNEFDFLEGFKKKNEIVDKKRNNDLTWKIKDRLNHEYGDILQLKAILKHNNQKYSGGTDDLLTRIADGEMNGALGPCPNCSSMLIALNDGKFLCKGYQSAWQKCDYITTDPPRAGSWSYPSSAEIAALAHQIKTQKSKKKRKLEEATAGAPKQNDKEKKRKVTPNKKELFKPCVFFLFGDLPNKVDLMDTIEKNGGTIAVNLNESVTHMITLKEHLVEFNYTANVRTAKKMEIPILDPGYVYLCVQCSTLDVMEGFILWKDGAIVEKAAPFKNNPFDLIKNQLLEKKDFSAAIIPPDENCSWNDGGSHVLNESSDIYSVTLNLTDVVSGKNSFYIIQIVENKKKKKWLLFQRWGRVSKVGGTKETEFDDKMVAISEFKERYFEKTRNRWGEEFVKKPGAYYPVDIDYSDYLPETAPTESNPNKNTSLLNPAVQELVSLIFDEEIMNESLKTLGIDTDTMPLGKLGYSAIMKGRQILEEIENSLKTGNKKFIVEGSNRYYTIIPHNFGFFKPPLLDTEEKLQREFELLNTLADIEVTKKLSESSDDMTSKYLSLKNEIIPLSDKDEEWTRIFNYVKNTSENQDLKICHIYKLNRDGEKALFSNHDSVTYRKLLWHGSCVSVFGSILSTGLKIMPHSGGRVGSGLYFADMFSKSANYLGYSQNKALILLNEVALGSMEKIREDVPHYTAPSSGYNSVLAEGRVMPDENGDYLDRFLSASGNPVIIPQGEAKTKNFKTSFSHNEYLVYDQTQVAMKYLLMLEMKSSWF